MPSETVKRMLKTGARFNGLSHGKDGKVLREPVVGPCEVTLTRVQEKAFADLLQPLVAVAEPPAPTPAKPATTTAAAASK